MAKEIVGSMSEWSGTLKDLFRQIDDGSVTRECLQAFLERRNPFEMANYVTIVDDGKKKTSELIAELRKLFPVCVYQESKVDKEFLPPVRPTSRKFLLTQEADEDLKNKSADDLERENVPGINLRERLIYEMEYYKKTGQHLDIKNITLCSGSRYSGGDVPGVGWGSGELSVFAWCDPEDSRAFLRSRRVVF